MVANTSFRFMACQIESRSRPSEWTAINPPRVKKLICRSVSMMVAPVSWLSSSIVLNLATLFSADTGFIIFLHALLAAPVDSVALSLNNCLNP